MAALIALLTVDAAPQTISGVVLGADGPVAGGIVRVRGGGFFAVTDDAGRFTLAVAGSASVPLTAWGPGHFVGTAEELVSPGAADVTIHLHTHPTEDNPAYAFISPVLDLDDPNACAHCHRDRTGASAPSMPAAAMLPVDEWLLDAHSQSAVNPRFLSLYNGTTLAGTVGQPTVYRFDAAAGIDVPVVPSLGQDDAGAGFRLDFPDEGGHCATCHAPILALDQPYDADPNHAAGVAAEGVTCDFCHKVWDVALLENGLPDPNRPGVLSLSFLRPPEGEQVFVGPFDDTPGDDIFNPMQAESEFCAACHFGEFWGVTMYNSFGEWLASPYSDPVSGQTCQDCHMPHVGATTFVQLPPDHAEVIPPRDPETIYSHLMPGALDTDLLASTATVEVQAARAADGLRVTVSVTNTGAGHHIPTDNPLRNMILLVQAADANGNPLALVDGPVIPAWGGEGDPGAGYYAGQPGVLYAKVLADFYTGETPTFAYWRQTVIVSDNRIPALATDTSTYAFTLPDEAGAVTVAASLWLRRAFIELMAIKGWDVPDM
ncbi:MAG: hypothetical protein JW910_18815, partial [Anaerolineae bacterium]|nr:hypothetical protein [Anaerolineae bacterium]